MKGSWFAYSCSNPVNHVNQDGRIVILAVALFIALLSSMAGYLFSCFVHHDLVTVKGLIAAALATVVVGGPLVGAGSLLGGELAGVIEATGSVDAALGLIAGSIIALEARAIGGMAAGSRIWPRYSTSLVKTTPALG